MKDIKNNSKNLDKFSHDNTKTLQALTTKLQNAIEQGGPNQVIQIHAILDEIMKETESVYKPIEDLIKNSILDSDKINEYAIMHFAAKAGEIPLMQLLLFYGANIDQANHEKVTPVFAALKSRKVYTTIRWLIKNGADVNQEDNDGNTLMYFALHIALYHKNIEPMDWLIRQKANLNQPNKKGQTPIFFAAKKGDIDAINYLINNKAKINLTDNERNTLMHSAAGGGNVEVMKRLKDNEVDVNQPNKKGQTPIFSAAIKGDFAAVEWLINNKAKVNLTDKQGNTLMHFAAVGGNIKVMDLLQSYGVNPKQANNKGNTPMFDVAGAGNVKIMEWLKDKEVDVDQPNQDGNTPMHFAAANGRINVLVFLTHYGVDPTQENNKGDTPKSIAETKEHVGAMKWLIDYERGMNNGDRAANSDLSVVINDRNDQELSSSSTECRDNQNLCQGTVISTTLSINSRNLTENMNVLSVNRDQDKPISPPFADSITYNVRLQFEPSASLAIKELMLGKQPKFKINLQETQFIWNIISEINKKLTPELKNSFAQEYTANQHNEIIIESSWWNQKTFFGTKYLYNYVEELLKYTTLFYRDPLDARYIIQPEISTDIQLEETLSYDSLVLVAGLTLLS